MESKAIRYFVSNFVFLSHYIFFQEAWEDFDYIFPDGIVEKAYQSTLDNVMLHILPNRKEAPLHVKYISQPPYALHTNHEYHSNIC